MPPMNRIQHSSRFVSSSAVCSCAKSAYIRLRQFSSLSTSFKCRNCDNSIPAYLFSRRSTLVRLCRACGRSPRPSRQPRFPSGSERSVLRWTTTSSCRVPSLGNSTSEWLELTMKLHTRSRASGCVNIVLCRIKHRSGSPDDLDKEAKKPFRVNPSLRLQWAEQCLLCSSNRSELRGKHKLVQSPPVVRDVSCRYQPRNMQYLPRCDQQD